jgi:phosphatidate cytidylyltransferase
MAHGGSPGRQAAPGGWIGSELGQRVASSVVMAAAALLATYVGGWLFAAFWLLAALAVLIEWSAITRVEPREPLRMVLGLALSLMVLALALRLPAWSVAAVAAAALMGASALGRGARDRLWSGAGFLYAAVIATVPFVVRDDPRLAAVGVLWMFATVWVTDVAAYFVGRGVGGPKLWPRVSPKKTWSGFLGGLLGAVLAAVAVFAVAVRLGWDAPVGLGTVILLSALASVLSQLGDLGESAMKRRFGAKDSGRLIPGHGGVMDRVDGFWAVAALMGVLLAGAQTIRSEWAAGG